MPQRYIVTKHNDPEAFGIDYVDGLDFLQHYDDTRETLSRLGVVIEAGELTAEQAAKVAVRPHIKAVEPDVEDRALELDFGEYEKVQSGPVRMHRVKPVGGVNVEDLTDIQSLDSDGYDPLAREAHELDEAYALGFNGLGVKVAVGDTGIRSTTASSTFNGRIAATKSFVSDPLEDGNGHGDFCCTAACPPEAQLIVGKVLGNNGSGARSGIISFVSWAVEQGAHVISMSLGGGGFSQAYEDVIKAAVDRGCMVFCASGNDGRENGPVNAPANSPSAIPCAAVDYRNGTIADFSCKGPEMAHGFAGAGVGIAYDPPGPEGAKAWSGTSMGTPNVACSYATLRGFYEDAVEALSKMIEGAWNQAENPPTAEGYGVPRVQTSIRLYKLPAPPPPPPPPPPPARKRFDVVGWLDLRTTWRPGTESPLQVWGELQEDASIKVRDWADPGMDDV